MPLDLLLLALHKMTILSVRLRTTTRSYHASLKMKMVTCTIEGDAAAWWNIERHDNDLSRGRI